MGRTRSLEGFFVGATWPSFSTGVTPARHGVHYLTQLEPGTYAYHHPATDGMTWDPFWAVLGRAGRRVAVLDVPLTRLDSSANGMQVVEWAGHDAVYGFRAWPPSVADTIRSRFGMTPATPSCDGARRTPEDYARLVQGLVGSVRIKGAMTRHFLRQGGWDLFIQVFTESHCVGHQCWHLHDEAHPAHDPAVVALTGDPLRSVYAAIDMAIGEIMREVGDALVVVLAAHGMSHWYGAQFLLRDILVGLGAATPVSPAAPRSDRGLPVHAVRAAWRALPAALRRPLAPLQRRLRPRKSRRDRRLAIGVDPGSSCCFPQHNGLAVGGIRLNLIGREPSGILEPGTPAERFVDTLRADLMSIVDERTGRSLIRRLLRTADIYAGERLACLPDLLVEWSDEVPTGSIVVGDGAAATVRASSPRLGTVEGVNTFGRTGDHRPEGLFIAAGPGVERAVLQREVSILEFAPTFTRLLGVELPVHDGRLLEELLH